MIYKFRIVSDENELFYRTIEIEDDDTFLSFHNAIMKACDFKKSEMTSFFISNDSWEKEQEITLMDMGDESLKTLEMSSSHLKDFLMEKGDRVIYQFDFFGDRVLFCTLTDIKKAAAGKNYPLCSASAGNPPLQQLDDLDSDIEDMFGETDIDEDDLLGDSGEFGDEFGGEDFGGGDFGNDYDY